MGPPEGGPFPFCTSLMKLNFSLAQLNFCIFIPVKWATPNFTHAFLF